MRDRRDPWKWPVTIGLVVSLMWAAIFVLPRSWLDFLLAPQGDLVLPSGLRDREVLTLLPPLSLEVVSSPPSPEIKEPVFPPPREDPRWWTEGWAVTTVQDRALFPAPVDTVTQVLEALGLGADFMIRTRPDSVLAARLFKLRLEDGFRYEELKPYLTQMARSRAYADILSRAADMYGEHLSQEIRVPD